MRPIVCVACKSEQTRTLSRRSKGLAIVTCTECDLVFTDPLPRGSDGEVGASESAITDQAYYQDIIRCHDLQESLARDKVKRLLSFYHQRLGLTPRNVLEIGCGTGQFFRAWSESGIAWTGVEASPRMLRFCIERNKPVIDAGSLGTLSSGSYDLIYFSQVLEHILDPNDFLDQVGDLLAPSGLVHLDVPNHDSILSRLRRFNPFSKDYGFIQPPHHLIAYRRKSLVSLMNRWEFEVVEIGGYPNSHKLFGQLLCDPHPIHRLIMAVESLVGTGSLLVCLAMRK